MNTLTIYLEVDGYEFSIIVDVVQDVGNDAYAVGEKIAKAIAPGAKYDYATRGTR